ncbi:MAG: lamin tail domain-containing protein [Proteobacteria bacterium]|nr:lamin tail domain-containing protein [Pseudomonadota bacterium]
MSTTPSVHLVASTGFAEDEGGNATWTSVGEDGTTFRAARRGASPTLVEDAINGHPAVRFTDRAALNGTVTLSAESGTVILVIEQRNLSRNKIPWAIGATYVHTPYSDGSTMSPPSFADNSYINWRTRNRSACGVQYGHYYVLTWVEDGNECRLFNNGRLKVTYTGGRAPVWGEETMTLGNFHSVNPAYSIGGHIAELLIYREPLADQERMLVERRLMSKYALGGFATPRVRIQKIVEVREIVFSDQGSEMCTDEQAVLVNEGQEVADLSSWTLHAGDPGQTFTFPEGTLLGPGATAVVWTRKDDAMAAHNEFSLGRKSSVWNNQGDVGMLRDAGGNEIHRVAYGKKA